MASTAVDAFGFPMRLAGTAMVIYRHCADQAALLDVSAEVVFAQLSVYDYRYRLIAQVPPVARDSAAERWSAAGGAAVGPSPLRRHSACARERCCGSTGGYLALSQRGFS